MGTDTGQPEHVVVVGGGLAAASTLEALRGRGFAGRLVLVTDEPHLPYDRPPLSKDVLLGELDLDETGLLPEQWYRDNEVELRLGSPAVAVRPSDGVLELSSGELLRTDRVVLTTGGVPRRLPIPGIDDPRVHVLRTRDECAALADVLRSGVQLVVLGAGLIGAEITAAAVRLGCRVTLVDPVHLPLAGTVGEDVATFLQSQHTSHGVRLVQGVATAIDGAGELLRVAVEGPAIEREVLEADAVVLGVGSVPNVSLAASAGLIVDNGVLVDAVQQTSHPFVFAAGDVARQTRDGVPGVRQEHWDSARRQGEAAACGLLGESPPEPTAPWFWSDRYDMRLEVVGDTASGRIVIERGCVAEGSASLVHLDQGRVVGAVCLGRPAEARALRRLVDRGSSLAEHDLADPSVDLRQLARV